MEQFSLSPKDNPNIAYSPSNMVYKNDTGNMFISYNFCGEIKFDGFLKRLDNAITKLPEKIKELENSIKITQENIAKYTRLVEQKPPYPRLEYLQALKWDHKTLLLRLSNGKGNAMLVAESVHNACRYFELFLETELKDKVAVITSYEPNITDLKDCGSNESEESYKYRTYCKMLQNFFNEKDEKKALNKTKEFEEEVKKRFINEPSRMKLLIVVDKLLTGFDAPSLTYLYIDKKMQDHGLFQAVCRVNRLDGEDKDFGCIIDYSDLFDSLQEAHSGYTNGAFENYEREDIQGLISNKAQKIKKKLEEARDQLRSLCESVKEPKDETDYITYFCGSDLEKNAQKRRLFYQLVGAFLRMFVELNHLEKPIYSKEEMQKIKQEAQFYRHLQKMIGLNSGDSVDLKSYSEDMHRILDAYIKATDSKTLIKIEDQGLCEVLAQMDINDFHKELSQVFKNESSMAESIANNTRKRIIEKEASNPKYYEKLSSLLNDLIN